MTEIDAYLAASLSRRFRLVRLLGAGGMGAVFLAEQIAVGNRPVALKVLSRKLLDDPDFLLRFQNEAASTGRIHHPNVVTIYESGQADDGTPYIAMEFLEGESLRQALARRGALPVPEVAEILQQAARGLNAAHKLGIIHRDLKPDNIFLTYPDDVAAPLAGAQDAVAFAQDVGAGLVPALPVGTADTGRAQAPALNAVKGPPLRPVVVKLVDFGIAKLRESGMHTQTGMVLGTPAYMSYEQASGMRSDELDARSDIYSLGVVVYEMLTGRTPFQSDTPVGYLRMHMQENPPEFRAVKPGLPALPQLESVVMKALTKDRDQRYGSALEFAREFGLAANTPGRVVAKSNGIQTRVDVAPAPNRAPTPPSACGVKSMEEAAAPIQQTPLAPKVFPRREGILTTVILWVVEAAGIGAAVLSYRQHGLTFGLVDFCCFSLSFAPLAFFLWSGMGRCEATGSIGPSFVNRWKKLTLGTLAFICLLGLLSWVVCFLGVFSKPWNIGWIETVSSLYSVPILSSSLVVLWRLRQRKTAYGLLVVSVAIPVLFFFLLHSFELEHTLTGHDEVVNSVTFSPDGELLASGSSDGTIKLWDVTAGTLSQTLSRSPETVDSIAISPDGKLLASRSVTPLYGPDNKIREQGREDNAIRFWDMPAGTLRKTLPEHSGTGNSIAFSPDGQLLASSGVGFSPDGQQILASSVASGPDGVELLEVPTGIVRRALPGPYKSSMSDSIAYQKQVDTVAFSPDGKLLAAGTRDGTINLWDVATGTLRQWSAGTDRVTGRSQTVEAVAFSPDGKSLATGSILVGIKLWDVATGKLTKTLTSIYQPTIFSAWAVAFSPDGKLLASGLDDGTIGLWNMPTGNLKKTLRGHESIVSCIAFSPDGKLLASGSYDKTIKLWRVAR